MIFVCLSVPEYVVDYCILIGLVIAFMPIESPAYHLYLFIFHKINASVWLILIQSRLQV